MATAQRLVAIVGPTASGKSAAAMQLALAQNGEIICADSRTVYQGMDIGTAKPSAEDQARVPHHLLDVVRPDQSFTVAAFQRLANQAIEDIQSRGKLPLLVGGTGLYIDAVLYNFDLRPIDARERQHLEKLSVPQLQQEISARGLALPTDMQNPRRLIRTLEADGQASHQQPLRAGAGIRGYQLDDTELKQRIEARVQTMLDSGLDQEVLDLAKQFGWQIESMKGIGYREWQAYFAGQQPLETTRQQIVQHTWQYVRRQRTWFKRNPDIEWYTPIEQPSATIEE